MTQEMLNQIIKDHALWLNEKGGEMADLQGADLRGLDLQRANLRGAQLQDAQLQGAQLQDAQLQYAQLRDAQLQGAQLQGAQLQRADLRGANLQGVEANETTSGFWSVCPEEGSFIAFKKLAENKIAKLLIPEHAKRSSGTSRKCRCSEAYVVEVTYATGNNAYVGHSRYGQYGDETLWYNVGETVYPDSFNEDRWYECTHGIHFFMTRKEAENY